MRAELKNIPVEFLSRGRYQPRRVFNEAALQELADSIRSQGVIEPIIVREIEKEAYEIIAGERRWRASQLAGLRDVPCIVRNYTDAQAAEVTLIENIQREELNPIEEAEALMLLIRDFHYTHEAVAKAVGHSRAKITNTLRLLQLDKRVQQLLIEKKLSEGHGKILAGLTPQLQWTLAQEAMSDNWSVRQLEQKIQQSRDGVVELLRKDPNVVRLEKDLSAHLGAEVVLDNHAAQRSGWVKVKYQNYEVLQGLLQKMGLTSEKS